MAALAPSVADAEEPERVILKLDQFLDMYDKTKNKPEETPPRDHTVSAANYDGEVLFEDGKPYAARFTAKMKVSVLAKKGWARVPLLPATVAVESAKIGGKEAPVVIENGFYTLVTDRRGDFDVNIVFGAAVQTAEGSSRVDFQLVPSGATTATLAVPTSEDLDFTVVNAKLESDRVVGKNRVVDATLPATGSLTIQWQREIPETEKRAARIYSEVYTLMSVGEGVLRATTSVQNTILFAGVGEFTYDVPKGMTVLDVQGPGIRDWKAGADGKLRVLLNFDAEGSYALTVHMERAQAKSAAVDVPILVPLGSERTKGWLGVESGGSLEIEEKAVSKVTAVDVRSLPASILGLTGQPILFGYKYIGSGPSISLNVAEHDEVDVLVTLVDQTVAKTMWTREGRRLTSVSYQVRNNRRQFLRLALPDNAELWSASVAGKAVQPVKAKDGRVMIPLVRSQQAGQNLSAFDVTAVYIESGDATPKSGRGSFTAKLPTVDVPSTYVAWTVYSPDKTKIRRWSYDGSLQHVKNLSFPIPTGANVGYVDMPQEPYGGEEDFRQAAEAPPPPALDGANLGGAAGGPTGGAAMGRGAAPVLVTLPLQGKETYFEKLLALDEDLEVTFSFRGLRR
jgi:hypothetical protein